VLVNFITSGLVLFRRD